jgi:hypothetical protein
MLIIPLMLPSWLGAKFTVTSCSPPGLIVELAGVTEKSALSEEMEFTFRSANPALVMENVRSLF